MLRVFCGGRGGQRIGGLVRHHRHSERSQRPPQPGTHVVALAPPAPGQKGVGQPLAHRLVEVVAPQGTVRQALARGAHDQVDRLAHRVTALGHLLGHEAADQRLQTVVAGHEG